MNDMSSPPGENTWKIRPFAETLVALRFLTRLPIPFVRTVDLPPLAEGMRFFPLAGALIGAISSAALIGANMLGLPSLLAATVALAVGVLITGALHEDGLADVADGFGGGRSREDRLEIMHDSRIGTYGTIALCLTFIGRAAIYETLTGAQPLTILALLASSAAFSRALVVDLLWATRPARSDGLSVFAGRPGKRSALFSLLTGGIGAAVAVGLVLSPEIALIAIIAAGVVLAGMRALAMRQIGGQTGDVCGAVQVLTELAMLTVFAATVG
ncbi:MAG: adenosylcobinamide-GDP ribazoletransferase [Aestuariivirga sp.]